MNEVVKNVVQMVFDNAGFEKNANTTLETLEKLKEALKFEEAAKGISNIGSSIKGLSMESFYNSVDKVQGGFNALEVVAIRVLQNITDKIQGMASNMLNAATLQPLKDGFAEYELQMNSVQTIMSSTGETVGKVNAYLDELNEYADRTIYSFSDMTANIGKFTNAGVSLDKAVAAIQGVSNVAAISGANTNEASRAMYNFAQALSAGSVKLIDWKSIETANMATVGFKEQLIQTAVAMGTLTKKGEEYVSTTTDANGKVSEAFTATKMFNDSLSAQWMTTDVLVQTLEQYSTDVRTLTDDERALYEEQLRGLGYTDEQIEKIEDLGIKAANAAKDVKTFSQLIDTVKESLGSGWTKTWQMVFGDLNEAKVLWTGVNDVISGFVDKVSDSRNAILEAWHKSGYTYNEFGELVKAVYDEEGKLDAELSTEIVENGKMIRSEMGGRDFALKGIENTYKTLAGIAKEFGSTWSTFFTGIDNAALSNISLTANDLIKLSESLYDWSEAFKAAWNQHDDMGNAIGLLGQLRESFALFATSMRHGYDGIVSVFSGLGNIADAFFDSSFFNIGTLNSVITALSTITSRIKDFGSAFEKHFGADAQGLNKNGLLRFFNAIEEFVETNAFIKLDFFVNMFDAIGKVIEHLIGPFDTFSQLLGKVGIKLSTFTDALYKMFHNEDVSKFEGMFDNLAVYFNRFIDVLSKSVDFSGFSKFFNNLVEAMTSDKVNAFGTIEHIFKSLVNVFKAFLAVATPVSAAFANIFGDAIAEGLTFIRELSERFDRFTKKLILNGSAISGLQNFFEGLFSVIKAVGEVLGDVILAAFDSINNLIKEFLPQGKELGDILTEGGDKLKKVAESISSLVSGKDGVPKLSELIGTITDKFVAFFKALGSVNLLEKLSFLFGKVGEGIKHALGGTEDMTLLDTITEKLKGFLTRLKDIFSDENGALDFVKILEAGGIGVAIKKLIDMFKELKKGTGDFKGFLGVFTEIKDIFKDLSETIGDSFKSASIKVIATSILEIAAALFIISMIDPQTLAVSVAALAGVFDMIDTLLLSLKGFNKSDAAVLGAIAAVIQTLGNSILMMAGAIAIIGSMEILDAMQGLGAIGILLQGLVWTIKELSSIQGDIPKVAGALIALAIALDLLTIPVLVLGKMDFLQLAQGLGAVAAMLAGLVIAIKKISEVGSDAKIGIASLAMIGIAVALGIMAKAIVKLSDVSWEGIVKGLVTLAAGLGMMVASAKVIADNKLADDLLAVGGAMIMLGVAMDLLAAGLKGIAGMTWADLSKGLAVFAVALVGLGVASYYINGKNLLMIGSAIFLVATAISQLAVTMNLAKVIGPICTGIAAALQGMSSSLEAFARHAAFDSLLETIKDLILFLPMLAVALAQAMAAFIVELGNAAASIVGAVVKIGQAVLQGIAQLLPDIWNLIKTNIEQLGLLIISEAPLILAVLNTLSTLLFQFLTNQLPNLFAFLDVLLGELINFLLSNVERLVNAAFQLIITFINAFADAVSTYAGAIFAACARLVIAIGTAIIENAPKLLAKGKELLQNILNGLLGGSGRMKTTGTSLISMLSEGISAAFGFVKSVISTIINTVISLLSSILGRIRSIGVNWIQGLASGILGMIGSVISAGSALISGLISILTGGIGRAMSVGRSIGSSFSSALSGAIGSLYSVGQNAISGFINGISSLAGSAMDLARSIGNRVASTLKSALKIASPSKVTYGLGIYFMEGLINGIEEMVPDTDKVVNNVATVVTEPLEAMTNASYTPVVAPVIDGASYKSAKTALDDMGRMFTQPLGFNPIEHHISADVSDYVDWSKKVIGDISDKLEDFIDYNKLGESVANSLISSGFYVKMDGGQMVGYLASEIRDVRRMYA